MRSSLVRASLALCLLGGFLTALGQDPWLVNTNYPMDTNASLGATVSFRVYASTTNPPLTYQWQHAGTDVPGATNISLVITNVAVAHAGGYMAWVSNASGGFTNSRTATLTVDPTFVKITDIVGGADMWMPYWVDFDSDGWLELVVSAGLMTSGGSPQLVYANNRDGTLSRNQTNDLSKVSARLQCIAWADLDNDGDLDGFAGAWEADPPLYLRNQGGGHFTKVLANRWWTANGIGVAGSSAASADFDNDGILDLVVAYFGNEGPGFWGTNSVLRGLGDGRFEVDRTSALAISHTWVDNWGWADWDGDGDLDLFGATSGDSSQKDLMFQNLGGGQFLRITNSPLVEVGNYSMVPAWGDYDNDGDLDICVASESLTNQLYRNLGNGVFEPDPASPSFPVGQTRRVGVWGDYDNDGWLDLFMSHRYQSSRLFHNRGDGTFEEIITGSPVTECRGRGAAWGDYNNDGFLDLCTVNRDAGVTYLYRNNLIQAGNTNGWLKVKLVGTASNRNGIGASIRVRATVGGKELWQMRQIVCQSYQAELTAHFGLGDATNVDLVRIEWPSGNAQELTGQSLNRLLTVTETTLITPPRPSASLNGSVTLTRTALAGASYQWRLDGVDLVGQTNRTLSLTSITADMAGRYSVVASNATTLVTNFVYLLVDTQFTKITTGAVVTDNEDSWGSVWVDYDLDGDVDLFVANGGFVGNQLNALYRNDGNGVFTRMTAATAGAIVNQPGNWFQASWADYDNDGLPDAMVAGASSTALYRNLGLGMFERRLDLVPASWRSGPGPCFADFDRDGWVDWFVCTAVSDNPVRRNSLYRNESGQAFRAVTTGPIVQDVLADTESGMWGDYDGDGDLDLVITLGFAGPNVRLYENQGGGVFQRAQTTGLHDNLWEGAVPVEAVWGDYDNDTRLDLFVAVYNSTTNVLFHNEGNGVFTKRLMGKRGRQGHPAWADYDNDGWLDLFLARGQVTSEFSQLWHNNGDGTFTEITTGSLVTEAAQSEGAAWGDYDNDGFMDLFVARGYINGRNALYRNNGNSKGWLKVKLEGTSSNRSAIGAKVKVRATINGRTFWQMREIPGGNRCQDDIRANFGLGDAAIVSIVRIEWPSGVVEEFSGIAPRQILTIVEPSLKGAFAPDGKFHLAMTMSTNRVYRLETSTDLVNWTTLTNCSGSGSCTPVEYVNPEIPASNTARFYRMK